MEVDADVGTTNDGVVVVEGDHGGKSREGFGSGVSTDGEWSSGPKGIGEGEGGPWAGERREVVGTNVGGATDD
jgi:hypothetical protein